MRTLGRVGKRICAGCAVAALLVGCDLVSSATNVANEVSAAAVELEGALGEKPLTGFNLYNGKLTYVAFIFNANKMSEKRVDEIRKRCDEAIDHHFSSRPGSVRVTLEWVPQKR